MIALVIVSVILIAFFLSSLPILIAGEPLVMFERRADAGELWLGPLGIFWERDGERWKLELGFDNLTGDGPE